MGIVFTRTEEGPPLIAADSATVLDPLTGLNRKIFAGQRVPPDLVEAYTAGGGKAEVTEDPEQIERVDARRARAKAGKRPKAAKKG